MYESKKTLRNYIGFKADPVLIMAVDKHAYQSDVTRSEYCRDAVMKKLRFENQQRENEMQDSEAQIIMKMINTVNNNIHTIMNDTNAIKNGTKPIETSAASTNTVARSTKKAAYFFICVQEKDTLTAIVRSAYPLFKCEFISKTKTNGEKQIEELITNCQYNLHFVIIYDPSVAIEKLAGKQLPDSTFIGLKPYGTENDKWQQIQAALAALEQN